MWDPQAERARRALPARPLRHPRPRRSETPPGPYSIDDLGRDVVELLDHLGIERAHVAGLALGGMTAMWLGDQRAASASTGSSCSAPPRSSARPRCGPTARRPCASRAPQAIVDGTSSAGSPRASARTHDIRRLRAMFDGIDDEGYAGCCAVIEQMDQTDGLPQHRRPDARDRAARRTRRRRRTSTPRGSPRAIPGSRLEVLDPGAHLVNVERAGRGHRR